MSLLESALVILLVQSKERKGVNAAQQQPPHPYVLLPSLPSFYLLQWVETALAIALLK